MSLYRFINIKQLDSLFTNNSLRLKRPVLWKDKWEGFPFELLDNEEGKQKVKHYLDKNEIHFHEDIITILKETIYCLCFSKTSESEALWNTYYDNTNVVRIEMKKQKIKKYLDFGAHSDLVDVSYVDCSITGAFLMEVLSTIIVPIQNGAKIFPIKGYTFKRKQQYNWENECRFICYDPSNLTLNRPGSRQKILHTQSSINIRTNSVPDEKVIKLACPINELIGSVLVHPDSDKLFGNKIEKMCKNLGVNYLGKSTMNKPPHL